MAIKVTDFILNTSVPIYYIYKVDKGSDNAISKIHFYGPSEEDGHLMSFSSSVQWLSRELCSFKCFACCGKCVVQDGITYFTRIGIVIPMIQDGKLFIKTISDDTKSNNLLTLEEAYAI